MENEAAPAEIKRIRLRDIWTDNKVYFIAFGILLLIGSVLLLNIDKGATIIFFSERRTPELNIFFRYATQLGEPFAYLIAGIMLLFVRYRYSLAIIGVGVTVTLISFISKWIFGQPRPARFFTDNGLFDTLIPVTGVNLNYGMTSYPSGHTMSGFGLYTFLALTVGRGPVTQLAFLILAATVGLSRIYLMQHFLTDVYLGSILGVIIAIFWHRQQGFAPATPHRWMDGKLKWPFL